MNKTGVKLYKWMKQRHSGKDEEFVQERCRDIWERFPEEIIARGMNHSACTSPAQLIKICKHYVTQLQ